MQLTKCKTSTLTQFRKCRISRGVSHTLNWVWSALFIYYYVLSRQDMPGDGLEQTMAVLISETDTRVLIEDTEVLRNVPSTEAAVAMLFGLTCAKPRVSKRTEIHF